MESLPDWIGAVLAGLALFSGGVAGGTYGAIRRMRVEERRHLLLDVLPIIRLGPVRLPAKNSDEWMAELEEAVADPLELADLRRGFFLAAKLEEGVRRYSVLPWKERALYSILLKRLDSGASTQSWRTINNLADRIRGRRITKLPSGAQAVESFVDLTQVWPLIAKDAERLIRYQTRLVNPRAFSKAQNLHMSAVLWTWGPWPWTRTVRDLGSRTPSTPSHESC